MNRKPHHRSQLRRAASTAFIERLERLREISASADTLAGFCQSLLRYVVYNEKCVSDVVVRPAAPDCEFDAMFRYACSDAQKKTARTAVDGTPVMTC